jgi:predicted helicase
VVRCIVRGIDHVIRTDFGLSAGVADRTSWADYSAATGVPIPAGLTPADSVIRMIDPATGTGTFLLEWLRQGITNLERTANPSVQDEAALVRLIDAFEINLSSYAVANLKTSLELSPELRASQRVGILLTDTWLGMHQAKRASWATIPLPRKARRQSG